MASKNIMLDILLNTSDVLKQIALINVIITFNFNFFFHKTHDIYGIIILVICQYIFKEKELI